MKIVCNHGYFFFYEDESGEIAKFNTLFNQDLVTKQGYYTFTKLKALDNYAIQGKLYGQTIAIKTYEAEPYEVMRQNNLVYNFTTQMISNKLLSLQQIEAQRCLKFYIAEGLIIPGSFIKGDTRQILGYTCKVNLNELVFRYSEFIYE
jgi:hypothetical protein